MMNCNRTKALLSEYIDERLSARETWEVDRHLAECAGCSRLLNDTRRTVNLLVEAPRREVSEDFMADLQVRIAAVEPEAPRRAWVEALQQAFRPRVRPAWGAALGACALALIVMVPRGGEANRVNVPVVQGDQAPAIVRVSQAQNIAITASDPLGDMAAASMAAAQEGSRQQQPAAEGG